MNPTTFGASCTMPPRWSSGPGAEQATAAISPSEAFTAASEARVLSAIAATMSFALERGRVDQIVDDRQWPVDRIGLLVDTHEQVRHPALDLPSSVAPAAVLHQQRVRERGERADATAELRLPRHLRQGCRLLAPEHAEESALLLFSRGRQDPRARWHRTRGGGG